MIPSCLHWDKTFTCALSSTGPRVSPLPALTYQASSRYQLSELLPTFLISQLPSFPQSPTQILLIFQHQLKVPLLKSHLTTPSYTEVSIFSTQVTSTVCCLCYVPLNNFLTFSWVFYLSNKLSKATWKQWAHLTFLLICYDTQWCQTPGQSSLNICGWNDYRSIA